MKTIKMLTNLPLKLRSKLYPWILSIGIIGDLLLTLFVSIISIIEIAFIYLFITGLFLVFNNFQTPIDTNIPVFTPFIILLCINSVVFMFDLIAFAKKNNIY